MTKTTTTKKTVKKTAPKHDHHDHDHNHDHTHDHNSMIIKNDFIELSIKWSEVEKAYQAALGKAAKQVKVAGFREGKVPAHIAEAKIETEHLITKTLEKVVPPVLQKEFERLKNKYQPVSRPEVTPLATKKGEDWKVKVSFAQKPKVNLAKFKDIVKKAKQLAQEEIKQIEELRIKDKKINKTEQKLNKEQQEDITIRVIFRELIKEVKPEIQELLVREETNYRLQDFAHQLKQMQISLEDYLEQRKIKFEELISQIQAEVLATLQLEFTLNAISEAEKITATAKDIAAEITKIKDAAMKKAYESNEYYQIRLKQNLIRKKTIDFLLSL